MIGRSVSPGLISADVGLWERANSGAGRRCLALKTGAVAMSFLACNAEDASRASDRFWQSTRLACDAVEEPGVPLVGELEYTTPPQILADALPDTPLVALARVETTIPSKLTVEVTGGGESWTVACGTAARTHQRPLLGLKPDTDYEATFTLVAGSSQLMDGPFYWRTPKLPADLPQLLLHESQPKSMEPGWTLFNVRSSAPPFLVVVDEAGEVRWLHSTKNHPVTMDHRVLSNGHLLFQAEGRQLLEMDWTGDVVATWYAANTPTGAPGPAGSIAVDLDSFHHETSLLPSGNFLTLSTELRTVDGFPTSTTDPAAPRARAQVVGDVIATFTPDGDITERLSLLDIIDPRRVGHGSLGTGWRVYGDTVDWSHSNAVVFDEQSDAFIVSVRHQDAVVKIDRKTASLVWILGTPANWRGAFADKLLTPQGELEWPFHQHAVSLTPKGLMMYDNGTYGVPAFEPVPKQLRSRVVEYSVDEEAMTVQQLWSYGPDAGEPGSFYSKFISDADRLPTTDNVLVVSGALTSDTEPAFDFAVVREVTRAGEVVFDLEIAPWPGESHDDVNIYRAQRIADLRH